MAKNEKKGLGRGLGALFGDDIDIARTRRKQASGTEKAGEGKDTENEAKESGVSRETSLIRLSLIEPNSAQPRKVFDEESLKELTESIRAHGVLQPILVQKNGSSYEILVGERRWRAARMAGLKEIPAIVKDVDKQEAAEIALIENIQREDLNSVEEARAYRSLLDEFGLTQEELASRVSKSRTAITNSLRLLQLDKDVLDLVESGELSAGHARAILSINGKRAQYKAAREVINSRLSVRETEKLAKQYNAPKREPKEKEPDIYMESLAEELTGLLSARVSIRQKSKEKGRIEIEYYSLEELEDLADRLRG